MGKMTRRKKGRSNGTIAASLVVHCLLALVGAAVVFAVALYLLASWSSGDFWPFDNGAQIPWESLARLALPATALLAGILGAVIAGHGQATRLQELRNSRDADVTERYTKAIEQLGSKHTAIRVGGIFALERIGHDSERDRTTIVNVLTSSLYNELSAPAGKPGKPVLMAPAEESALMVALMRLRKIGETNKLASYLKGNANLENADLHGAYLSEANMTDYPLFLANVSEADLSKAILRRAILFGTNFSSANLQDTVLSEADLQAANFSGANLRCADLTDANLNEANFSDADLRCANLRDADMKEADFSGADLRCADLTGADLTDAIFKRAQLKDAQVDKESANKNHFSPEQLRVMKIVNPEASPADAEVPKENALELAADH
jgi:uncharacterized protein YjbI with pentapeptide repeats